MNTGRIVLICVAFQMVCVVIKVLSALPYDATKPDNVVMIGAANKNVHTFNTMVRDRLGLKDISSVGDQVVVNENWVGAQQLVTSTEYW